MSASRGRAWRRAQRQKYRIRRSRPYGFDPKDPRQSKRVAWAEQVHNCSCYMCRCGTRKGAGNSLQGMTLPEIKGIDRDYAAVVELVDTYA
jgi:hypothetical protein